MPRYCYSLAISLSLLSLLFLHSTSMSVSREEERFSMFTDTDVLSFTEDNESIVDAMDPQQ